MKYNQEPVHQDAVARFGELEARDQIHYMPAVAPSPRTKTDAAALVELAKAGVPIPVVSPLASCGPMVTPIMEPLLARDPRATVKVMSPMVFSDPEAEALSFNCVGRHRFEKNVGSGRVVGRLMTTGLKNTHSAWRQVGRDYSYGPVADWAADAQANSRSQVLMGPTPIVRANANSVDLASNVAEALVPHLRRKTRFGMYGVQMIFHGEFFRDDPDADQARQATLSWLQGWQGNDIMRDLWLGIKVHDTTNLLADTSQGHMHRMNVSAFVSEASEYVRQADGALITQNWDNLALGLLDSGADIVTARMSGPMNIELPIRGSPRRGPQKPPKLFIPRQQVEWKEDDVKEEFKESGAYPVAPGVDPEPYWDMRLTDKRKFCARAKAAALIELGREYREAGLDPVMTMEEAVASRVHDSHHGSMLRDLCPSVNLT